MTRLLEAIRSGDLKLSQKLWDRGERISGNVFVRDCLNFTGFPDGFTAGGYVDVRNCPLYQTKR